MEGKKDVNTLFWNFAPDVMAHFDAGVLGVGISVGGGDGAGRGEAKEWELVRVWGRDFEREVVGEVSMSIGCV